MRNETTMNRNVCKYSIKSDVYDNLLIADVSSRDGNRSGRFTGRDSSTGLLGQLKFSLFGPLLAKNSHFLLFFDQIQYILDTCYEYFRFATLLLNSLMVFSV